ncbi:potassium/proton antiporter [Fulvivirga sp. RKSG066]|uniref:potassium/proton antiporter n=1 Tax=Fulvivirga aurantia TaxID=2529383 RepID=UPI001626C3AF|nr:potassium/proton antiporter [Fulvivirga aurantia]
MTLSTENILLVGAVLLFLSVIAGKTSYKFGVPTLILFLAIGMLAGSEGLGGIYFDDPKLAQFIGIVSLNFILFSGGLDTNWKAVKPVLTQGLILSTLGVFITAITLGVFVYYITDFTLLEGLLLGAIVSSTDAAAVFSILRSKNLSLKSNIRPTLELESGSNDPMAYVLTIAILGLVVDDSQSIWETIPFFLMQMVLGVIGGIVFAYLGKESINKIKLGFEGLYPVLVIAIMLITFSVTDAMGGNGFLAVYLCAVYLGNHDLIHKGTIIKIFDGLAWLMQIVLFLTLGLLVFPSQIVPLIGLGILVSLFLIFIARPLSIMLSLAMFKMKMRRRLYISWVGLRGAVPIVFATYPLIAGVEKANMIFNLVFFVAVSSVLLQGTTLTMLANWLKVGKQEDAKIEPADIIVSDRVKTILEEFLLTEKSGAIGKRIVDLNFPKSAIIAMINRKGKFITPNGATELQHLDKLTVLSNDEETMKRVRTTLS